MTRIYVLAIFAISLLSLNVQAKEPSAVWLSIQNACKLSANGAESLHYTIQEVLKEDLKWHAVVQSMPDELRTAFINTVDMHSASFLRLAKAAAIDLKQGTNQPQAYVEALGRMDETIESLLQSAQLIWAGVKDSISPSVNKSSSDYIDPEKFLVTPTSTSDTQLMLWYRRFHRDPKIKLSEEARIKADIDFIYATAKIAALSIQGSQSQVTHLATGMKKELIPLVLLTVATGVSFLTLANEADGIIPKTLLTMSGFYSVFFMIVKTVKSRLVQSLQIIGGWQKGDSHFEFEKIKIPKLLDLFETESPAKLSTQKLRVLNGVEIDQLGEFELQHVHGLLASLSSPYTSVSEGYRRQEAYVYDLEYLIALANTYRSQITAIIEEGSLTEGTTALGQRRARFDRLLKQLTREFKRESRAGRNQTVTSLFPNPRSDQNQSSVSKSPNPAEMLMKSYQKTGWWTGF